MSIYSYFRIWLKFVEKRKWFQKFKVIQVANEAFLELTSMAKY